MNRIRSLTLLVLLLSSANAWSFQLSDLNGKRDKLQNYIGGGKWTLVMLWSLDCIPCEKQKPMIQRFHSANSDTKAQVIGIALDGTEHSEAIQLRINQHKSSYTNLIAFSDVVARQLQEATGRQVVVTPSYLLYRPDGSYYGLHTGMLSEEQLSFMTQKRREVKAK